MASKSLHVFLKSSNAEELKLQENPQTPLRHVFCHTQTVGEVLLL